MPIFYHERFENRCVYLATTRPTPETPPVPPIYPLQYFNELNRNASLMPVRCLSSQWFILLLFHCHSLPVACVSLSFALSLSRCCLSPRCRPRAVRPIPFLVSLSLCWYRAVWAVCGRVVGWGLQSCSSCGRAVRLVGGLPLFLYGGTISFTID